MKPKKTTKKEAKRDKNIEKRMGTEKLDLDHPNGKERFDMTINNSLKIKSK
ncbi:MAG TPA: hypothetical protein VIH90_08020 [Candidatus Saccharimonadales bacterium]